MPARLTSYRKPRKSAIADYRSEQRFIAIHRDGGFCVFHYFLQGGKKVPFDHVHHVYGRSRLTDSFREKYISLLCTCYECHPQPISNPGTCPALDYVESVLYLANHSPINKEFLPPTGADHTPEEN